MLHAVVDPGVDIVVVLLQSLLLRAAALPLGDALAFALLFAAVALRGLLLGVGFAVYCFGWLLCLAFALGFNADMGEATALTADSPLLAQAQSTGYCLAGPLNIIVLSPLRIR